MARVLEVLAGFLLAVAGCSGPAAGGGSPSGGGGGTGGHLGTGADANAAATSDAEADSGPSPSASGSSGGGGSSGGAPSSGSSGASGSGAGGGSGDGAADSASSASAVAGCTGTTLLATDPDTSVPGPWPVGVQTVQLAMTGGSRPVEVWYPATVGSDSGQTAAAYNVEDYLPNGQASKIPASANKVVACNCYRGLPLDTSHGPYPAVIFLHGTGSFRYANLSTMVQWASRGFIVIATDHAGLYLTDFLVTASLGTCTGGTGVAYGSQDLSADVDDMIAALTPPSGGFSFLGSGVDMTRIGISGHSQGAQNAAQFASKPNVQVDMPLADLGGTVPTQTSLLKSVLVAAGTSDSVVPFSSDQSAYTGSTAPIKRLVGITGGNHLDVTDLCTQTNAAGQTAIEVANQYGVCGAGVLAALAKCGGLNPPQIGPDIVNYVTTAALEETLHCQDRTSAFSNLETKYPAVGVFDHAP
jgi:predicted dienelactone hydrolase